MNKYFIIIILSMGFSEIVIDTSPVYCEKMSNYVISEMA